MSVESTEIPKRDKKLFVCRVCWDMVYTTIPCSGQRLKDRSGRIHVRSREVSGGSDIGSYWPIEARSGSSRRWFEWHNWLSLLALSLEIGVNFKEVKPFYLKIS